MKIKSLTEIDQYILTETREVFVGALYILIFIATIGGGFVIPVLFIANIVSGDLMGALIMLITGLALFYIIRAVMSLNKSSLIHKKRSYAD